MNGYSYYSLIVAGIIIFLLIMKKKKIIENMEIHIKLYKKNIGKLLMNKNGTNSSDMDVNSTEDIQDIWI